MRKKVTAVFESAWSLFRRLSIIEKVFTTLLMMEIVHVCIVVALWRPQLAGASTLHFLFLLAFLSLIGLYLVRMIRLLPEFFRNLSTFEKALMGLIVVWIGFGIIGTVIGVQLPDYIDAVAVVAVLILVFTNARRFLGVVLWRLRNRLIATYIFIGIVPIVLIVSMLGIVMYMLAGQGVAYLITTELERRSDVTRNSALTIASGVAFGSATESPEAIGGRVLDDLRARFPTLNALVRVDGRDIPIGPNPVLTEFPASMVPDFRVSFRWNANS